MQQRFCPLHIPLQEKTRKGNERTRLGCEGRSRHTSQSNQEYSEWSAGEQVTDTANLQK